MTAAAISKTVARRLFGTVGALAKIPEHDDGTALDHYPSSNRSDRLAPSACAPVGARGSVAASALENSEEQRTSGARIRIVVFAD